MELRVTRPNPGRLLRLSLLIFALLMAAPAEMYRIHYHTELYYSTAELSHLSDQLHIKGDLHNKMLHIKRQMIIRLFYVTLYCQMFCELTFTYEKNLQKNFCIIRSETVWE